MEMEEKERAKQKEFLKESGIDENSELFDEFKNII